MALSPCNPKLDAKEECQCKVLKYYLFFKNDKISFLMTHQFAFHKQHQNKYSTKDIDQ